MTRLYQGTQSYLFYLTRELGLVNKLFRGHSGPEWLGDELEQGKKLGAGVSEGGLGRNEMEGFRAVNDQKCTDCH